MTKLLKKAFEDASKLSMIEQNALAKWLLEELNSERKWDTVFAVSENILEQLADEAIKSHKQGKNIQLDIDKL